jgi:hypothetical protein
VAQAIATAAITTTATATATRATIEATAPSTPTSMPAPQLVSARVAAVYPLLRLAGYAANRPLPPLRLADGSRPEPSLKELPLLASGPR